MRTYIYPRAIKRIADDLLALGDELLNKVSGMEEGVFGYLDKGTLLDEVDAGIGIVVVFGLLTFDNTVHFTINGNSVYIWQVNSFLS